MVLLEIDKKYPHNNRLLGEHRWSEILRNPSNEEQGRASRIFHSFYTTGREAQKDGTRRSSSLPLPLTHARFFRMETYSRREFMVQGLEA